VSWLCGGFYGVFVVKENPKGLYFENSPGLEDFPCFTFEVASPELPCGVSWLGNCLLELGMPLWKPWGLDVSHRWERMAPFRYRYTEAASPLQQTLPALVTGREFTFRPHLVPRFTHRWPLILPGLKKVIFFVRDPRDALYSEWCRQRVNYRIPQDVSFVGFVGSRYYHYPFSFRDYLLLFLRLWKSALTDVEHLIVRFEDYKADALTTLRRVVDFLDLEVTVAEVVRAAQASDFHVAKKIEEERAAKHALHLQLNRAGIPLEYRFSYSAAMHDSVGPVFNPLYEWLGYENYEEGRLQSFPSALADPEVDEFLAAMDASKASEVRQRKLAAFVRVHAADLTALHNTDTEQTPRVSERDSHRTARCGDSLHRFLRQIFTWFSLKMS
jgi:hypothetical protein